MQENSQDSQKNFSSKNSKTKFIVLAMAIVLVFCVGVYYSLSKNPKITVIKAFLETKDEFTNTLNDFTPTAKVGDMISKYSKDGVSDMSMEFGVYPDSGETSIANLSICSKNNPLNKQSALGIKFDSNGFNIDADFAVIDNDIYLKAPTIYENPIKIQAKTLGKDIANSQLKSMTDTLPELKELSFDFFAEPVTQEQMQKGFLKFAKPEIDALQKNMTVDTLKNDHSFKENANKIFDGKKLSFYTVTVKNEDVVNLTNKMQEYAKKISDDKYKGLETEVVSNIKYDEKSGEYYTMYVAIDDKKRLVGAETNNEKSNFSLFLAGEKNTTDKIALDFVESENELKNIEIEFANNGEKHDLSVSAKVDNKPQKKYIEFSHDGKKASLTAYVEERQTCDMNISDVKSGKSFTCDFANLPATVSGMGKLNISGKLQFSVETPEIKQPENAQEVLKFNEKQYQDFSEQVALNLQKNYGPLMALLTMFS